MATARHETRRDGRQISAQAQLVRHILSEHRGESNAISAAAIGRMVGLSKRQVSDIVRELRLHGEPIGSRPGRPGFWWIVDQREAREVYRRHVERGREHFRTAAAMRQAFPVLPPVTQTTMVFDEV